MSILWQSQNFKLLILDILAAGSQKEKSFSPTWKHPSNNLSEGWPQSAADVFYRHNRPAQNYFQGACHPDWGYHPSTPRYILDK